jgi:chromatin structure-remodeling complex protein RSC7
MFYPAATQPTVAKWTATPNAKPPAKRQRIVNDNVVIIDNIAEIPPFVGNGLGAGLDPELGTGYGEWDDMLIDALETEEEKAAVRAQVERERKYRAIWA